MLGDYDFMINIYLGNSKLFHIQLLSLIFLRGYLLGYNYVIFAIVGEELFLIQFVVKIISLALFGFSEQ